jgi:predicted enzyme related to lactoylglutathione lyase
VEDSVTPSIVRRSPSSDYFTLAFGFAYGPTSGLHRLLNCLLAARWDILRKPQMSSSPFGFQSVKVIALAATDVARAKRFYSETLQLEEDREATDEIGYRIGNSVLVIRQHPPTDDPNPRITLQVQDAKETEKRLKERAVTISDPVKLYEDKFWVGGFLDSEGNKLWFCSYA